MANTRDNSLRRRAAGPASAPGLRWVSELQLDAYLQARDALRRARGAASMASAQQRSRPGPSAP